MVAAGSYLHRLETGAANGVPHDLRGALAVYGGSLAYADQVLSLAEPPAPVAGLPVVFPIPAPGWVQRIAVPQWPADLAAHMSPSAVTNQCVAGALATWAMMDPADPRWNHLPPLFGNAIDLAGVAQAEGFQLDNHPTPGAMVVYGSAYGVFGHIATVRAVEDDRYEAVEQNFLDFDPALQSHWATFDLRSVGWPDPAVEGVRGVAGGGVRADHVAAAGHVTARGASDKETVVTSPVGRLRATQPARRLDARSSSGLSFGQQTPRLRGQPGWCRPEERQADFLQRSPKPVRGPAVHRRPQAGPRSALPGCRRSHHIEPARAALTWLTEFITEWVARS